MFVFICLNFLSFVLLVASGEVSISYACENNHGTVYFEAYTDVNSTIKYWKDKDTGESELIASVLNGVVEYYGHFKENVLIDEDRNLVIVKMSEKYEGVYRREIRNGDTTRDMVLLKNLVPPSGPPEVYQQTDSKGQLNFSCGDSNKQGKPKAAVVEYNGNKQSECCWKGESVNRCYPKHLPRCSPFSNNVTGHNVSLSTHGVKETKEMYFIEKCEKKGMCIAIASVSFVVCLIIFYTYNLFLPPQGNVNKANKELNNGCNVKKYTDKIYDTCRHPHQLIVSLVIYVLLLVLSSGYFCSKEDCENGFLMVLIGVSCFIIGTLLFISSKKVYCTQFKMKKLPKENKRFQRAYKLIPQLEHSRPLLGNDEDTDNENDQTSNGFDENEDNFEVIISGLDNPISRKQNRKYNKIEVLRRGLFHQHWNLNQKQEIMKIMTPDYMSSEESEYEDEGEERKLKCYKVKHISWEDEKFKDLKQSLYKVYETYEHQSRYPFDKTERVESKMFSERPVPRNAPEWVVKGNSSTFLEFITSGSTDNLIASAQDSILN